MKRSNSDIVDYQNNVDYQNKRPCLNIIHVNLNRVFIGTEEINIYYDNIQNIVVVRYLNYNKTSFVEGIYSDVGTIAFRYENGISTVIPADVTIIDHYSNHCPKYIIDINGNPNIEHTQMFIDFIRDIIRDICNNKLVENIKYLISNYTIVPLTVNIESYASITRRLL